MRYVVVDTESSVRLNDNVRVLVSLAYDVVEADPLASRHKKLKSAYEVVRCIQVAPPQRRRRRALLPRCNRRTRHRFATDPRNHRATNPGCWQRAASGPDQLLP